MSLPKKSQDKLQAFLTALDSGAVQPEDLTNALEAVMTVIESANRELDQRINKSSENATGALSALENRVSQATSELQALIRQVKAEETTDKEELRKMVAAELLRIESKIPQIPEQFDATELYNDIQSHKEMLTRLSELIVGENIRNALEALPEGEKLVMEAIEGLPELLEKLSQMEGKGNVVGGVTRALVEQLIAESGGGSSLPDQTGNNGKFLTTDGTDATWEPVPGGGDMLGSNNLSDVANAGTSRTNLGLGTAAVAATGDFATAAQGTTADSAVQNTGNETVAGVKTFSSSPIIPAPSTDLQAATKKYVDDNGGGFGISWSAVTANTTMAVGTGSLANKATLLTLTLPATSAVGETVRVAGMNAGLWKVAQAANQYIKFGNQNTTTGTGGSLASVSTYDAVELVCIEANVGWVVVSSQGNITVT